MLRCCRFLVCIFFISLIYASCNETHIDINTASAEELDEIIWVGPATAEKIIAEREFESVDDLIRVYGIGETKLADIKKQGLACVVNEIDRNLEEEKDEEDENKENSEEKIEDDSEIKEKELVDEKDREKIKYNKSERENFEIKTISLTPQNIKTGVSENLNEEGNWTIYGLIAFFMLIVLLMLLKKKEYKNEFRE